MEELLFNMKQKYNDFNITRQHLGRVIRANNRTRKRTRHQHYPKERRNQLTDKNKEMEAFYNEVHMYPIDKIICLDETSVGSHLKPSYSICYILVDEFRTSYKCSNCDGGVCEKFRVRKHPNKKKDELRLIHGLLRCKSGCGLWNRDRNGSSNIYKIAKNAINKLERPSYLCREISNQALLPSCYKQTLQGNEKSQLCFF